ncbi:MAG TPA: hypothetical protein VFH45_00815 [Acidimicrobiales bacterium]|nr:hypothetical protein [Acidimicrobiales bacterium]
MSDATFVECDLEGGLPTLLIRRRALRESALAVLIHSERPMAVGDILAAIEANGCVVDAAQPHKALADALGHQVTRGRVRRRGWGVYQVGTIPRTTSWRIRRRWAERRWPGRDNGGARLAASPTGDGADRGRR